jgi:hypothetical protein
MGVLGNEDRQATPAELGRRRRRAQLGRERVAEGAALDVLEVVDGARRRRDPAA